MTKQEMAKLSDYEFAAQVLEKRLADLPKEDTPLANRLRQAVHALRRQDLRERMRKACWWEVTFTDERAGGVNARMVPPPELERIGQMVGRGYYCGVINYDNTDESEVYFT